MNIDNFDNFTIVDRLQTGVRLEHPAREQWYCPFERCVQIVRQDRPCPDHGSSLAAEPRIVAPAWRRRAARWKERT